MREPDKKSWLWPAAVVAVVFLCGQLWLGIMGRNTVLTKGQEIVLKSQPIDPRDLLRGRYVRLEYPIEILSSEMAMKLGQIAKSSEKALDSIYLQISADGNGVGEIVDIAVQPDSNSGVWLKAKLPAFFEPRRLTAETNGVRVDIGLDRFYAQEDIAPTLEANMRDGAITEIVIAVLGEQAQIKGFRQNGQTIFTEALY